MVNLVWEFLVSSLRLTYIELCLHYILFNVILKLEVQSVVCLVLKWDLLLNNINFKVSTGTFTNRVP